MCVATPSSESVCKTIDLPANGITPLVRFTVCSIVLRVLTVFKTLMRVVTTRMAKQQQTRLCGCYICSEHSGRRVGRLCQHLKDVEFASRIFTVCVSFSFINGSNNVHINCRRLLRAFFMTFYTGCSFSHALWTCHTVEVSR